MGNPDLLFIFTLTGNWKWKTIIKGQEYDHTADALALATKQLQDHWGEHNRLARDEERLPQAERTRLWVDFRPLNVQIEEIYIG